MLLRIPAAVVYLIYVHEPAAILTEVAAISGPKVRRPYLTSLSSFRRAGLGWLLAFVRPDRGH